MIAACVAEHSPIGRINLFVETSRSWKADNLDAMVALTLALFRDENIEVGHVEAESRPRRLDAVFQSEDGVAPYLGLLLRVVHVGQTVGHEKNNDVGLPFGPARDSIVI